MPKKTERLLSYCRSALSEIRNEIPVGALWERRWASLITLLRTACEVLEREAPLWKDHMKQLNADKKGRDAKKNWEPAIYGKFIYTDANLFLHEGSLSVGQSAMISVPGASVRIIAAG